MLRVLLAVSANFPDNPRKYQGIDMQAHYETQKNPIRNLRWLFGEENFINN